MNSERYQTQNYVPINPKNKSFGCDLNFTLQKMTFDKIVADPDHHFRNCYVTNFDLIHHECRGDTLLHSREHYETIYKKKLHDEIKSEDIRYRFLSAAVRSERKDVGFEKSIFSEHFARDDLEEKLEKKHVFLSSMKKKAYFNKTDDCKSLKF